VIHNTKTDNTVTYEPETRLVNRVDFLLERGITLSSQDTSEVDKMDLTNCKQPLKLSELLYCDVVMKTTCDRLWGHRYPSFRKI